MVIQYKEHAVSTEELTIQRRPSKERLREYIVDRIESGKLAAGDSLVSARQLSGMFGISLHTVRGVIKELEDEGWLQTKHRIGTFVVGRTSRESVPTPLEATQTRRVVLMQIGHDSESFQETAFFAEINRALERYLMEHGVGLTYSPTDFRSIDQFFEREADNIGVVIAPTDPHLYALVRKYSLPCVGLLNLPEEDFDRFDGIASDNEPAAYTATRYLLSLGHESICYLGGGEASCGNERLNGYQRALQEANLEIDPAIIEIAYWTVQGGYESMLRVLSRGREVTGVFAANDLLAFGAIRAIHESDRKVPSDISVVGFDDWELATHMTPPLTTMRVDRSRIGTLAGQFALKRLAEPNREGTITRIPATLIVRGSTCTALSKSKKLQRLDT